MTAYLEANGRRIAHVLTKGTGPGVVFLGGFVSDMLGTKAVALEDWARRQGRAFLRFDYSGHGQSSGRFEDGCVGEWRDDAIAALAMTEGPQILVGSSMGGWISLLIARDRPDLVAGLVTVAAAPDFTAELGSTFTPGERAELAATGAVRRPSTYSPDGYVFTRRLIEDGAVQGIFDRPLNLPMPVRMLQGTADEEVAPETATRLLAHASGPDIRLTLVKSADHRFSTPDCLRLIEASIEDVTARLAR